jgi:hypothetical protein
MFAYEFKCALLNRTCILDIVSPDSKHVALLSEICERFCGSALCRNFVFWSGE